MVLTVCHAMCLWRHAIRGRIASIYRYMTIYTKNLCFLDTQSFENGLEFLEPQLKDQIPEVVNCIETYLKPLKKPVACHHPR